ncbi:MAG TPA: glycosyl hydrolase [Actinomycetota bacterium]|nr:glycosyl hydrolase [Actinomycetota bacterium]
MTTTMRPPTERPRMAARPTRIETFREPSRDYGILPFWFLNGELDPDEMRFQLRELRDKGMQGVILHGRYGLEMPYVGDTYLERIRLAVDEANELGLATWIYDEMNWPSGTADKRVLAARPDLAQRYIECVSFEITGPWFMCLTGEDSRYLDFERSTPVAAFAIGEDDRVIDLTRNLSFEKVVPWEVPPGTWRLCYIVEKRADYYIDALDPESTTTFLQLGYQPYADAIGTLAGRLVGFYSDEPAMHYFRSAADDPIVPWTKEMFGRFRERNGYDLRPRLVDLFFDLRPDAAKIRHDFYTTLTEFYSSAYYAQIRDWCRDQGVVFTAHLLYEEWLRRMVRVEGNLFHHYRNMDVVAVDHLYPVIGTREAPDQHVAIKVASSAAHQVGSERLICESFGGIFMDATMQRMKWIADWEFVLGVNVLNPHGFHYTLEGARKRDWPPSMFYQYPWWRYYEGFSTYMSRLSEMLTGGRHVAKVAVVWPIDSMFASYLPQDVTEDSKVIESGLNRLTDLLLRLHHDFDYVDEESLAAADVSDGRLRIGEEDFELVIVPPMTHVRVGTLETLERLAAAGGRVLGMVRAPRAAIATDGLVDIEPRIDALLGTGQVVQHPGGGRGAFVTAEPSAVLDGTTTAGALGEALGAAISELIEPDVEISNDELFCLHRVRDGRDVFFVINPTTEPQEATMSVAASVSPVLWDPSTGEELAPAGVRTTDGRTRFELELPPVGSVFVVGGGDAAVAARPPARDEDAAVTLEGPWTFEPEGDNALVLTAWKAAEERDGDPAVYTTGPTAGREWLDVVAGAWAYQLPAEPDRPFPIPVWYRASFTVADVPERLALVIDGFDGSAMRIHLNGALVDDAPVRARFDAQMQEVDLSRLVVPGVNELAIRLTVERATGGIVDHLKLVGSFGVASDGGAHRLVEAERDVRPAPWTELGYPFLSGTGAYRATVERPAVADGTRILLDVPMRDDVLEVEINGAIAGVRLWDPYSVDVTDLLRPGANEIVLRVANTIANLLNGVDRPSGIAGPPRLVPAVSEAR